MSIQLTQGQVTDLARPMVGLVKTIIKFYENPENERKYREWHLKKYGCEPDDEVVEK